MLRIRFLRRGRKKQPFYRIVVTNKNNPPKSGRFVEDVGFYNPLTKECEIKKERVLHWREKGAQISDTVKNLFIKKGIIEGKKVNVVSFSKKRREKMEANKKESEVEKKEEETKETKEEKDVKETAEIAKEANKESKSEKEDVKEEKEEEEEAKEAKKEEAPEKKEEKEEETKENDTKEDPKT